MSLMDKFIDPRAPGRGFSKAPGAGSSQTQEIIRNIQNILQARRTTNPTSDLGLLDFCEQSLSEPLVQRLCKDMQQQIKKHEKRLTNVQVTVANDQKHGWNFLVSADLVSGLNVVNIESINFVLVLSKSR